MSKYYPPSILKSILLCRFRIAWLSFLVSREYALRKDWSMEAISLGWHATPDKPYPWDVMSEADTELCKLTSKPT